MGEVVPSSFLIRTLCFDEKSMDLTGVHLSQFAVQPAAGQLFSAGAGCAGGGPETRCPAARAAKTIIGTARSRAISARRGVLPKATCFQRAKRLFKIYSNQDFGYLSLVILHLTTIAEAGTLS